MEKNTKLEILLIGRTNAAVLAHSLSKLMQPNLMLINVLSKQCLKLISKKPFDLSKSKAIRDLKYLNSHCRFIHLFTKC